MVFCPEVFLDIFLQGGTGGSPGDSLATVFFLIYAVPEPQLLLSLLHQINVEGILVILNAPAGPKIWYV